MDILLGGAIGYAAIGLIIAAVLRPSTLLAFVAVQVITSVTLRLAASLASLGRLEASVLAQLVFEQIIYSGLSAGIAFLGANWFAHRRDNERRSKSRLYKE